MVESKPPKTNLRAAVMHTGKLLRPYWRSMTILVAAGIVLGAVNGVVTALIQKVLFDALAATNMRAFAIALGAQVATGSALHLATYSTNLLQQRVKNHVAIDAVLQALRKFYSMPFRTVSSNDSGYFVARIFDEPGRMATQSVDITTRLTGTVVTVAGGIAVALWLSWSVTMAALLTVPIMLWSSRRFHGRIVQGTTSVDEKQARLKDSLGRAVRAYRAVKLFDLSEDVRDNLNRQLTACLNTAYRRANDIGRFQMGNGVVLSCVEAVVFVAAGIQVARGNLSVGGLLALLSTYWRVVNGFRALAAEAPVIAQFQATITRIDEFQQMPIAPVREADGHAKDLMMSDVALSFGDVEVLSGFSANFPFGSRVLVRGPNGSGKSTLANLLMGFLEPTSGRVTGPSLDRVSALVTPATFAPGSLRENVRYQHLDGRRRERFAELCQSLGLTAKVDSDLATCSQGEQRRAQTIMALMKEADLYLFDEPLANVDRESRSAVIHAVTHYTGSATVIVIAHDDDAAWKGFSRLVELGQLQDEHLRRRNDPSAFVVASSAG